MHIITLKTQIPIVGQEFGITFRARMPILWQDFESFFSEREKWEKINVQKTEENCNVQKIEENYQEGTYRLSEENYSNMHMLVQIEREKRWCT